MFRALNKLIRPVRMSFAGSATPKRMETAHSMSIRDTSARDAGGDWGHCEAISTPSQVELETYPIFGEHQFTLCLTRQLPSRYKVTLHNAAVYGQTSVIFSKGRGGEARRWWTHRELQLTKEPVFCIEDFEKQDGKWIFSTNPALVPAFCIDRAVLIGGRFSINYFHFIAETMVRAAIANAQPELAGLPFLVPTLHPNMMEMLRSIAPARSIITIHNKDLVSVNRLSVPVSAESAPDDPAEVNTAVYDAPMLPTVRDALSTIRDTGATFASRVVFIRRRTYPLQDGMRTRSLVNQETVVARIKEIGGIDVDPEHLTVPDQKALFSGASIVIAMAGAGLGNMIYAKPGAAVIVLMAGSTAVSSEYFALMAQELGLKYAVVACRPIPGTNPHPSHLSVEVDLSELDRALDWARS